MALYRDGIREDVISGAPGSINAKPIKAAPIDADMILIEDSAAGFEQKKSPLSAFPEKHTQGTDLGLDTGGANPITAAAAKAHVDAVAGNPHAVTKTEVSLGNVSNDAQLKIASNLSDLASAATARTNLGLGTMAVANLDREFVFHAEYTGSVIAALSGSAANDLQISADHDDTEEMNYWQGTTEQAAAQDRDIVKQFTIPAWAGTGALDSTTPVKIRHKDTTGTNTGIFVAVKDSSGNTYTSAIQKSAAWTNFTIALATLTGAGLSFAAGDRITVIVRLKADQSETAYAGDMILKVA